MSKKVLLPTVSILVVIPLLALFLVARLSSGSALADQPPPPEEKSSSPWPSDREDLLDSYLSLSSGKAAVSETAANGDLELELVGRWPYGPSYAIAVAEVNGTPYAFLGSGGVVLVLDMTDLSTPTKVSEVVTPGVVRGLTVSGSLALVADGSAGLRVIDISDPASPTETGFLDTPGLALGVAVSGSLALVADWSAGLRVIDIFDPASPQELGFLDTPGLALGVAVSGSLALVADSDAGLRVIDISDPAGPVELGFLDTPGFARGVAVSGSLALVADGDAGLAIMRLPVTAPGPGTVEGNVTLQLQADHSGTTITVEGPESVSVTTGPEGSFSVTLPPGTYTVRAEHPYHLPAEATIELGEGETLNLEVELLCCDLDQDGDIDANDLAQLAVNIGRTGSAWR